MPSLSVAIHHMLKPLIATEWMEREGGAKAGCYSMCADDVLVGDWIGYAEVVLDAAAVSTLAVE
jgi:hypothetical protein